jgi:hypothetical protein
MTTPLSAGDLWAAYQAQSDIVGKEKQKLRDLNMALIAARKACKHEFRGGACLICGENMDKVMLLEKAPKPAPAADPKWPDPASYKFVD